MDSWKRMGPRERGFTLVEIMVVVVIIGLLATLVAKNVFGSIEQGKLNKTKSDLAAIAEAAEMYRLQNNQYPEELQQLVDEDETGRQFLRQSSVPKDPWTGQEYRIDFEGAKLVVFCDGFDGSADTDDDITTKNMADINIGDYLKIINQGN